MYNNAFCKAISWNIAWVCSVRCGKCQLCKSVQICSNLFNALQPYATCDPHRRRTNQRTAFSAWSSWSKAAPTTRERVSMPTAFSNLGRKEIAKQTDTTNINKYQETNINKHQLIVRATRVCSNWLQTWLLCWKQDVATYTTQICVGIIPKKKRTSELAHSDRDPAGRLQDHTRPRQSSYRSHPLLSSARLLQKLLLLFEGLEYLESQKWTHSVKALKKCLYNLYI